MKTVVTLFFALICPAIAKEKPLDLTTALEKSLTSRSADFPKDNAEALKDDDRTKALLDLRYLMEMESILRELRHDEAALQKQVEADDLSSSEKKRLLELRAETVVYRTHSLVTPGFKQPRTSPVEKLTKAFQRKARKPLTEISRNRKSLDRELDRDRPDERKISKLENEIEAAEKILATFQIAFFGGVPSKGFEAPFDGQGQEKPAALLVKVIAARDQLIKTLRLDPKKAVARDSEDKKKGIVGGIQIRSSKLGVILDNSTSMRPHIPDLRKEIDKGFPDSLYRECYGCALTWKAGAKKLANRDFVLLHMEDLIIVQETDALYWFSDLRDPVTEDGLRRLAELLKRSGALFYVSSVDQKPDDELEELITGFKKK